MISISHLAILLEGATVATHDAVLHCAEGLVFLDYSIKENTQIGSWYALGIGSNIPSFNITPRLLTASVFCSILIVGRMDEDDFSASHERV